MDAGRGSHPNKALSHPHYLSLLTVRGTSSEGVNYTKEKMYGRSTDNEKYTRARDAEFNLGDLDGEEDEEVTEPEEELIAMISGQAKLKV